MAQHAQRQRQADKKRPGNQHHNHGDGKCQILPDHPARLAAEADGVFDQFQLVAHQHHVGGFQRHIGTGRAHRHANGGGCQRRGIVHTVAHHRHRTDFILNFLQDAHLVLRQQAGIDAGDAQFARDGVGHPFVITGQHGDFLHADLLQVVDHGLCFWPDLIRHGDNAHPVAVCAAMIAGLAVLALAVPHHPDDRFALGFQRFVGVLQMRRRFVLAFQILEAAQPHHLILHFRDNAHAGDGLKFLHFAQRHPARFGFGDNGLRQRMFRARLDGGRHTQKLLLAQFAARNHIRNTGLAHRERAGFIEGDRLDRRHLLDVCAALKQHTGPRRSRNGGNKGGRGADHQRTGRGDRHEHHRQVKMR